MTGKKRARSERRVRQRELVKLVGDRERLVALTPGGSPARAIEVDTPAVIEVRAASAPCHQCGGAVAVEDHVTEEHEGDRLRVARTRCRRCHTPRAIYFRLRRPS